MDAAAHNPEFAQQAGIPQSVAKDFSSASKGMQFKGGPRMRADLQKVNRPKTLQGKTELYKEGGNTMATKKMNPGFMAMMAKKKGAQEGSKTDMASDKKQMMKMAKGGSASARADGVAQRGKTKGKMLAKGGKAC